jgi:hypothetical protein
MSLSCAWWCASAAGQCQCAAWRLANDGAQLCAVQAGLEVTFAPPSGGRRQLAGGRATSGVTRRSARHRVPRGQVQRSGRKRIKGQQRSALHCAWDVDQRRGRWQGHSAGRLTEMCCSCGWAAMMEEISAARRSPQASIPP